MKHFLSAKRETQENRDPGLLCTFGVKCFSAVLLFKTWMVFSSCSVRWPNILFPCHLFKLSERWSNVPLHLVITQHITKAISSLSCWIQKRQKEKKKTKNKGRSGKGEDGKGELKTILSYLFQVSPRCSSAFHRSKCCKKRIDMFLLFLAKLQLVS